MPRFLPASPALATFALTALALGPSLPLGTGCVVRYEQMRPAEPLPPPADFAEVESRLEALISDDMEIDRRDRIELALDLLRVGRTMDPEPQQRVLTYLQRFVAVEERNVPMEAPALFEVPEGNEGHIVTPGGWLGPRIDEEDLGGFEQLGGEEPGGSGEDGAEPMPEPAPGDGSAPTATPADVPQPGRGSAMPGTGTDPVDAARSALAAGDPAGALASLEPCVRVGCADGADAVLAEARDAFVRIERERAGQLFMQARSESDAAERQRRLEEAREILAALLDRYPQAAEADAVRRNIETVSKELEALR